MGITWDISAGLPSNLDNEKYSAVYRLCMCSIQRYLFSGILRRNTLPFDFALYFKKNLVNQFSTHDTFGLKKPGQAIHVSSCFWKIRWANIIIVWGRIHHRLCLLWGMVVQTCISFAFFPKLNILHSEAGPSGRSISGMSPKSKNEGHVV